MHASVDSRQYFSDHAWLPSGWQDAVRIEIDQGRYLRGALLDVKAGQEPVGAERIGRFSLPGMVNLHSHAFQRAMAGLAEHRGGHDDSFWTWREAMYRFAGRIGPDELRAIATQLYVEMLQAGYTHVCEFHYLHHQPDGRPYDDPSTMSLALVEAAQEAGIGMTLLPVLYMSGGFDGRPLEDRQRRFGHDVDNYLRLVERLRMLESSGLHVGIALHSLRAVPEQALQQVLAGAAQLPDAISGSVAAHMPVHIHIAEQTAEVDECLQLRGAPPVQWLLDHVDVDARWCLVHATHMSGEETRRLAATGAVAGLCPTTEANLGDGIFALPAWLEAGGALGIGSDSHVSVSVVEELRWLEYAQRLLLRQRNVAATQQHGSTGENLLRLALAGGAQAAGMPLSALYGGDPDQPSVGARADLVVLDDDSPWLAGRDCANLVDTWIFAGNANLVRDVMVNGEWVIRDGVHADQRRINIRYRRAVEKLLRA